MSKLYLNIDECHFNYKGKDEHFDYKKVELGFNEYDTYL